MGELTVWPGRYCRPESKGYVKSTMRPRPAATRLDNMLLPIPIPVNPTLIPTTTLKP